ncbi:acetate--CoA ligase family protein [Verticiella sediminum]|uniref:Acetate--CoA ligase family protein n=1 Tax=Verticiella sediminum TaxID=1247510 RepID=A0A556A7H2_9BURK|nr:acetate--CoA ligase family protein [Verticiella sediminum]TSH88834.1 acetate--CoA ligase family protein [Verticiella sediminum]
MSSSIDRLDSFFAPRSIAIVGASDTPTKIGGIPLTYQLSYGFDGAIYPINPTRDTVQGQRAWPSLRAVGEPIDLAIFAIPAQQVEAALEDAIAAGVRNVVLFSAGYAEVDDAGRQAQERLAARARAADIRFIGPNCLGFINIARNAYATFAPAVAAGRVAHGDIAVVSQSGAFGIYAYALARARGLGLSYWATTGNEADIQVADCIEWLAKDPGTRVILLYLEGCRDGARLRRALAAARTANKPVVAVKVGRTAAGASAAASHTASLAGDDAVYDAVFREYGVWRTHTIEDFFNVGYALSVAPRPTNPSVGVLTVSGGVGALMADDASLAGLELTPMPEHTQQWLREKVPFAAPVNPVDITAQVTAQPELLDETAYRMLDEGGYGSLLIFLAAGGLSDTMWPRNEALAASLRERFPDRTVVFVTLFSPERKARLQALGVLAYDDPSTAIRAVAALQALGRPRSEASAAPAAAGPVTLPAGSAPLTELQALALLEEAGVPTVPARAARTADEAVAAAQAVGWPVVLKVLSPDIAHKSDVGGVRLNLRDEQALRAAHAAMLDDVRAGAPHAHLEGVLVAPMVGGGIECILGTQLDPVFGPVVMFGLGGVDVELQKDFALRLAPVSEDEARAMMRELRSYPLLTGYRGRPPADLDALARAISRLSTLAADGAAQIASIDVNPFIARPGDALALDALVVRTPPGS